MKKIAGFLLVVAPLFLFGNGCAFGTRHAVLTYPPASSMKASTNSPFVIHPEKIALGVFTDERGDKTIIGYVRNGYGMKTAEVHLDSDVVPFINDAVRYELRKAGWETAAVSMATNADIPVISGEVLVLHCDAMLSYEGDATLMIHATKNGRETFRKTYSGNGGGDLNWAMTNEGYGKAVSESVQEALQAFVRDIPTILRQ